MAALAELRDLDDLSFDVLDLQRLLLCQTRAKGPFPKIRHRPLARIQDGPVGPRVLFSNLGSGKDPSPAIFSAPARPRQASAFRVFSDDARIRRKAHFLLNSNSSIIRLTATSQLSMVS